MSKRFLATAVVLATFAIGTTALADDTPKDTDKKVETKTKSATKKAKKKSKGAVEDVTKKTDEAASDANKAIVGEDQQDKNEREARKPRPTDAQQTHHEGAEKVGKTTTTAAEAIAEGVEDVTRATDKPGKYNPFAIEWAPLGLFVGGRVSLNAEYAPVTHHVIVLSPHFVHTSADVAATGDTKITQTFTGAGAELGYRYYTGHKGMNGVFVGPSLIGGVFNAALPNGDQAFTNYGIAVDVGVQEIFADHFVLGGGVGLEYLKVSKDFGDLSTGPSTVASTGFKPRFLLEGGYAF
jgi:hypothetical protein